MPVLENEVTEGVLDQTQKVQTIPKVTITMVKIEGEAMRGVAWVWVKRVGNAYGFPKSALAPRRI
jgi:4-oxalocrotonate tautomerase